MSRIGKKPIVIPDDVTVSIEDGVIIVKGPKGELKREFSDEVEIKVDGDQVVRTVRKNTKRAFTLWGTYSSHIQNMIEGVSKGFEKKLQLEGIGYRAALQGSDLNLSLGFSHPVVVKPPDGVNYQVDKNIITVSGIDKEKVGNDAARIRALRKPEPYKGKGIRYEGEVVMRKAGKKMAGTAT